MELSQIIWKGTSSKAPPKHMHISNVLYKQDASTIAYEYDYEVSSMQPIYTYKEHRNMKVYAQTISPNHPIPPTSKTRGRWMVYNRIQK